MTAPGQAVPGRDRGRNLVVAMAILGIISISACLASGCTGIPQTASEGKIIVAVTIPPQEEMVREIGGDRVEVVVAVPPGADPHSFEPTVGDVAALSSASLYCRLGPGLLPLEDNLVSRLSQIDPGMTVIDTSQGIVLLRDSEEGGEGSSGADPHIWLSPKNAQIMAGHIRDALARADPENATVYQEDAAAYDRKLEILDQECETVLAPYKGETFITIHPAWAYLADRYGLIQLAIEEEGKEATIRDIERIVTVAREKGIHAVYVEPQYSPRSAELIAEEIDGKVFVIDDLAPEYVKGIRTTVHALAEGMSIDR